MEKMILHTDGGSRGNPGLSGAGVVVLDEKGEILKEGNTFLGVMTNNEAEYRALLFGLETIKKLFGKTKIRDLKIEVRLDSELICRQLNGEYQIKEERLVPLFIKIWNLRIADFKNLCFKHIPREKNVLADKLANEAMDRASKEQGELL